MLAVVKHTDKILILPFENILYDWWKKKTFDQKLNANIRAKNLATALNFA